MIIKNLDDTTKLEDYKFPTKEEYFKNVKQINEEELHSDKFKTIKEFVSLFNERKNLELEKHFFKIVGTYGLEDKLVNKSYDDKRISKAKRYSKLKQFMNSLTPEQISSDMYLTAAAKFMETSLIDCKIIIENLRKQIKNLEIFDENIGFEINIDIPKERLNLFPMTICELKSIPYYKPQDYKYKYIYLLDENNRHIYEEYNKYVSTINKIARDIYHLQMWNLLFVFPEQINNYYFSIINNEHEHQFKTAYYVKKCRNSFIEKEPELYQIIDETKKRLKYDLRLGIDNIPIDEEIIVTIGQAEDKIAKGPKLVLKRNATNKKI